MMADYGLLPPIWLGCVFQVHSVLPRGIIVPLICHLILVLQVIIVQLVLLTHYHVLQALTMLLLDKMNWQIVRRQKQVIIAPLV